MKTSLRSWCADWRTFSPIPRMSMTAAWALRTIETFGNSQLSRILPSYRRIWTSTTAVFCAAVHPNSFGSAPAIVQPVTSSNYSAHFFQTSGSSRTIQTNHCSSFLNSNEANNRRTMALQRTAPGRLRVSRWLLPADPTRSQRATPPPPLRGL